MKNMRNLAAALLLVLTLGACSNSDPKASGVGDLVKEGISEGASEVAEETVYDAATAPQAEQWAEYVRLVTEAGLPPKAWATNAKNVGDTEVSMCSRTQKQMNGLVTLMRDLDAYTDEDWTGQELFYTAFCPEQLPLFDEAMAQPEKNADGTYRSSCDYLLGDFTSYTQNGYRFTADASVKNTGNVGIVAELRAAWFLSGGGQVTATKKVRVPYGQRARVGLVKPVGQDEIDRHQSLGFNSRTCTAKIAIVNTFGTPQ